MEINRFGRIVGGSPKIRRVFTLVRKAARVDIPVLIAGETGTGKDLIACEIHARSLRQHKPFVAVNMGVMTRDMVASELFGHVKGAFTGATETKQGRFSEAEEGTLFLDEIATMEEHTQVALLRVLEAHSYRPLGARSDRTTNVRLIAATNESLEEAVEHGHFRRDLFHRLQVLRINVPALREIREDIPMLAYHALDAINKEFGLNITKITDSAMQCLQAYDWPGNVRELKNVIAHSAVLVENGLLDRSHFPSQVLTPIHEVGTLASPDERAAGPPGNGRENSGMPMDIEPQEGIFIPFGATIDEVQKVYVAKVLAHFGNNKTKAAKTLGVSRKTLYDWLNRWTLR